MQPLQALPWVKKGLEPFSERFRFWVSSDVPFINDYINYTLDHPGKLLRPLIVLTTSGKDNHTDPKVLDAALLVELIHIASLAHDDVIDRSDFRRGVETLRKKWGDTTSILFGDFLLSRAFTILAHLENIELTKMVCQATTYLCEGELMQNHWRFNFHLPMEQYFKTVEYKTARLISISFVIGAILTNQPKPYIDLLLDIGLHVGIAYQLYDDCLDYMGDGKVMGKPNLNDMINGTATLPLILLLNQKNGNYQQNLLNILKNIHLSENQTEIFAMIDEQQCVQQSLDIVYSYSNKVKALVNQLSDTTLKDQIVSLLEYITHRNS